MTNQYQNKQLILKIRGYEYWYKTKYSKHYTHDERATFMKLFNEYKDVFMWRYEDLKTYDMKIIQHVIPLK